MFFSFFFNHPEKTYTQTISMCLYVCYNLVFIWYIDKEIIRLTDGDCSLFDMSRERLEQCQRTLDLQEKQRQESLEHYRAKMFPGERKQQSPPPPSSIFIINNQSVYE
jgi:hypothetical protein